MSNEWKDIWCFSIERLNIKGTWADSKVYMKEEIVVKSQTFQKKWIMKYLSQKILQ